MALPERTTCCVVGGGPAGMVLAYLLARAGVETTLLEAQDDFDRDFRGDTIHPATMELMADLGLAERLLERPHVKVHEGALTDVDRGQRYLLADLRYLRTRFPYITLMAQPDFLAFLAEEAARLPTFRLAMDANVTGLIEEDGVVRGARVKDQEVRADLVVGADGRSSRVRRLAGLALEEQSPPMDVLWFRIPRAPEDPTPDAVAGYIVRPGGMMVLFSRGDHWQCGFVIPKGEYRAVRDAGIAAFREAIVQRVPWLAGRLDVLDDWADVALLTVQAGRAPRWHRPGLLLIGDAAHPMSPVGGVGINYAIQDAVETANRLTKPLRGGALTEADLAAVQRRREPPTRRAQRAQRAAQDFLIRRVLEGRGAPFWTRVLPRLPLLRRVPARLIGFGFGRVRVEPGLFAG